MLSVPETALYTVFSHGRDGRGSYTSSGVLNGNACDSQPGLDSENCNGDGVFRSAVLSRTDGDQFYDDSIEFSETILDTDAANAGPVCPPGIAGIPGFDESGLPICFSPAGGHFFEVCGLSVIKERARLASVSPCNGTFINSTGANACPDGYGIIESGFGLVKNYDNYESPIAKFYTCVPLGNDGYRFSDNTFVPNGKTASCSGYFQNPTTYPYIGEAWVEEGVIRTKISKAGSSSPREFSCSGSGLNVAVCRYSFQGSYPGDELRKPVSVAIPSGLVIRYGNFSPDVYPAACTAEWR